MRLESRHGGEPGYSGESVDAVESVHVAAGGGDELGAQGDAGRAGSCAACSMAANR
jgi:hypothetical protein